MSLRDFTTFTETDPNSRVAVTASSIVAAGLLPTDGPTHVAFSENQYAAYSGWRLRFPTSLDAAIHIFGFNREDKFDAMRRMGLANHPDGKQFLANFELEYVEYIKKEDAEELSEVKVALDEKQSEIDGLHVKLEAATARIAQLETALEKASAKKK